MTTTSELSACRAAFEKWADEEGLSVEMWKGGLYYEPRTQEAWAAYRAGWTRTHGDGEAVALSDDDVERLSLQAGWEGNRKYMTKADFHIWCDRMRAFAALTHPPRAKEDEARACQRLPSGWRIEVRNNGKTNGLCVIGPDGSFAIDGMTNHNSDIRQIVIDQLQAAMAEAAEGGV